MYFKNICINNDEYLWKNLSFLKATFFRREKRKNTKISNLKFLIKALFKRKRILNEGLWLIDNWSYGYFHWFADVLQKYYLLNEKNVKIILPIKYSNFNFIVESAKLLDIQLLFVDEKEIIKCKNLIIVPTLFKSGNYYESVVRKMQLKFFNKIKRERPPLTKNCKILYLSREKTQRRKVVNEEEILNLLEYHNGRTAILEDLQWREQLELFSNCEILISPHGAGLTNMFFLPNKAQVIEFRHVESTIQNMYFSLASALRIKYYYIICKSEKSDTHLANITVPIKKLEELLNELKS